MTYTLFRYSNTYVPELRIRLLTILYMILVLHGAQCVSDLLTSLLTCHECQHWRCWSNSGKISII